MGRIYRHGAIYLTWVGSRRVLKVWSGPHHTLTCTFGWVQGVKPLTGQQWPNTIAMRSALTRVRGAPGRPRGARPPAGTAQLHQRRARCRSTVGEAMRAYAVWGGEVG